MATNFLKSRRSGGPKTAEGKLVSSRNSLKTGVYSVKEVLPGEDLEELNELEQLFIDDFQPQGISEATMVRSLVVIAWKKLRLEKLDYRYIRDKLMEPFDYSESESLKVHDCPELVAHYLLDANLISGCDGTLAKEYVRACNYLEECGWSEKDLKHIKKEYPNAFDKLYGMMLAECEFEKISLTDMSTIRYSYTAEKQPIQNVMAALLEQALADVWVANNKDKLLEAHRKVRDQRLSRALQFDRAQRATDDLDRSFFKTLAELRKQQEWRMRHEFIDVESRALDKP